MMMIGGLEAISEGTILAAGAPITEPRPEIGIVFQDPTLLPWKTALQNVLFPIEMMRRDRAAISRPGDEIAAVWSGWATP